MMDKVEELFETRDLYEVLDISPDDVENASKLKKAYLRAALKYHPDKAAESDKEITTQKFQIIKKIYEIFQDDDLRKEYDETGDWPDGDEFTLEATFGRLNPEDIENFRKSYVDSDEERQDIKKAYIEGKGDLFYVIDNIFFGNILTDEERIQNIIDDMIEKNEMKKLDAKPVSKSSRDKKIKKAEREAKEAEESKRELGLTGNSMSDLKEAIAKRQASRDEGGFLDMLAEKYGGGGGDKKSSKKKGRSTSNGKSKDEPPKKKGRTTGSDSKSKSKKPKPKRGGRK